MAKRTVATAAASSTPLEQIQELHQLFLDRFNRNSVPMGEQLTTLLALLQEMFNNINKELEDDDAKIAALEELLKKAGELLKKLEGIDLDGLDPEKIKQKVLEALAAWQAGIQASLEELRGANTKQDFRLDQLESGLEALRKKVESIDFQNIDPEKIKQKVLDALASWRTEIGNAILSIQGELRALTGRLQQLEQDVQNLRQKVDGIDVDPEKIKKNILDALAGWQANLDGLIAQLDARLNALTKKVDALELWKPGVDTQLSNQEKHLQKHDGEISRLQGDLKALSDEVGRIIAQGGPDPEDIKRRVLAALAPWQQLISDAIAGLDSRLSKDEKDILQHLNWIIELQKQVADILKNPPGGTVDPEDIKNRVLEALAAWKKKLEEDILQLKNRLGEDEKDIQAHGLAIADLIKKVENILKRLPELETLRGEMQLSLQFLKMSLEERLTKVEQELSAQVKRLDARITAIETVGVDPDDVRKIIEEEFKSWKLEIIATFVSKDELAALQKAINLLTQRVEALKTDGLNAEEVKALLHSELDAWRDVVDKAIALLKQKLQELEGKWEAFDTRLDGDEEKIKQISIGLSTLKKWVEEKLAEGANEAELKAWVQNEIDQLSAALDERLKPSEKKIILLKDNLDDLRQRLDALVQNAPNAETLKSQILLLLSKWQLELEKKFGDLKDKVGDGLKDLRHDLDALEKRVNQIVLTGGTPADVEERIRKAIEAWEAKLKRELDAIRQRNEEDRIGLLTLRDMFSGLQERVRLLEVADFGKAISDLIEQCTKAGKDAKKALEKADDLADDLAKLTKQGGVLEVLQKHLNLLIQQSKHWVKKEEVQALIEEALKDIEACKKDLCETIQWLKDKVSDHDKALADLKAADLQLRTDFEKKEEVLEERIGQVGVLLEETADELEAKIKDAEKDAKEYARDHDRELEHKLDKRLDRAEHRLDCNDEIDEAQRLLIEDLQRQIDEWQPDPSGDVADRLARRCLEGHGIVCGFDVWHSRKYTLYIGPGAGVSSDGHILKWNDLEHFTHYKAFKSADDYPFFVRNERGDGQKTCWPVWQLVAEKEDETEAGVLPLTPQRSAELATPFIQDKIVLALLAPGSHPAPENLTFVLMNRHHAMAALNRSEALQHRIAQHPDTDFVFDETFSHLDEIPFEDDLHLALRPELGLKEIPLPRFGLYLTDGCTKDELDRSSFPKDLTVESLFNTYLPIVEDVLEKTTCEMRRVVKLYHKLLFPQWAEEYFNHAIDVLDDKWTAYKVFCKKHKSKPDDARHYIQYFYDWARDLINGYHELRAELLQLMVACCIRDADDHPRHLLLGLAMREEHTGLASPLRHAFHQPPIYNGNAARLETCRLYLRRWLLMLKGFMLPIHKDPETNPVCHCDEDGLYPSPLHYEEVKITPGRSYFHALSRQSIPFYYLVTLGTQSVHRFWDYRRSKTLTENQHLCYHANDTEESYSSLTHVIRPLHYSFDAFDFYRVEGHIGKAVPSLALAKASFWSIVQKYNLDFDVEVVEAKNIMESLPGGGKAYTFASKFLGAEHLAGVPKGGTLILVVDEHKVVADFSIPYRCCEKTTVAPPPVDCKPILEEMVAKAIDELETQSLVPVDEIRVNQENRAKAVEKIKERFRGQIPREVEEQLLKWEEEERTINEGLKNTVTANERAKLERLKELPTKLGTGTDCEKSKETVQKAIDELKNLLNEVLDRAKPWVERSNRLLEETNKFVPQ